jgi:hypothetical protein
MGSMRGMVRAIDCVQRKATLIPIEIDENGGSPQLLTSARHATVSYNGVGDYTLTLSDGASRPLQAFCQAYSGDTAVAITARTNTSLTIAVTDLAGAAKDSDLGVFLMALDSTDDT